MRGSAGLGDEADGGAGPGDETDGSAGPGDEADGGAGNLYLFRLISAVWVEIYIRRLLESLPFSADFRCLGRDLWHPETNFLHFRILIFLF